MARKHETIDDYISGCSPEVVPLLEELTDFVHATLASCACSVTTGCIRRTLSPRRQGVQL